MRHSSGARGYSFDLSDRGRHVTLASTTSGHTCRILHSCTATEHPPGIPLAFTEPRQILGGADRLLVNSHPHNVVAPRIYADARADIHVKGWIAPPGVECCSSRTSTISNRSPSRWVSSSAE
jgi:hypothetical protein